MGKLFRITIALGLAALILPRLVTSLYAWSRLYDPSHAPEHQVAIVFGAGLRRDGSPTQVLRDRLETAVELYMTDKVDTILLSGHQSYGYSEPQAMRQYLLELGVPEEAIQLDSAGSRTYDTCYRARHTFGLRSAILVTQRFHLPRALYTCHALGIDAAGVPADRFPYRHLSLFYWHLREFPATLTALWDVYLRRAV